MSNLYPTIPYQAYSFIFFYHTKCIISKHIGSNLLSWSNHALHPTACDIWAQQGFLDMYCLLLVPYRQTQIGLYSKFWHNAIQFLSEFRCLHINKKNENSKLHHPLKLLPTVIKQKISIHLNFALKRKLANSAA